MNPRSQEPARTRRNRGRPRPGPPSGRREAAPARARLLALRVLERVERSGAYADLLLHGALARSGLAAPDRAFTTDLVYGTLRWRGRLDYLLAQVLDRELASLDAFVANALRLGAYQLVLASGVPASAAVDESVRCVRAAGLERATGLVNAVLRRLAAEHARIPLPELEIDPLGHLCHALSLPEWLARRWLDELGPARAAALARASNRPPPLTVRANPHRGSRDELLAELATRFPEARACRYAPRGIVLGRRGNPALDPAFAEGRFTVQDEGSQLVVSLLDPQPGERVLDLCAAPGGKATAIAEEVGRDGDVLAIDRHGGRLDLVRRAARRLGLSRLRTQVYDALLPLDELAAEGPFDRVLVDAPCSGLGTLRRNPDLRWRVAREDPARLAALQGTLLRNAAKLLRPGGVLVYSTCTLLPEENEGVVDSFLAEEAGFARTLRSDLPVGLGELVGADGLLRCDPHTHDTDGFRAVRLERRA